MMSSTYLARATAQGVIFVLDFTLRCEHVSPPVPSSTLEANGVIRWSGAMELWIKEGRKWPFLSRPNYRPSLVVSRRSSRRPLVGLGWDRTLPQPTNQRTTTTDDGKRTTSYRLPFTAWPILDFTGTGWGSIDISTTRFLCPTKLSSAKNMPYLLLITDLSSTTDRSIIYASFNASGTSEFNVTSVLEV